MESRLIGKIVNRRFRIEDTVGWGGMAIVYRAYDLKAKRTVALKVLRPEYEKDAEYVARFKREADVCRRLNHPNIINMVDSGTVGDMHYMAMEFVDGKTLKDLIAEKGRIPEEEAVHYALQVLSALGHAHARHIIHRDIKSQNIMVARNGQIKVGDFGIAGIADTQTLTGDGSVIGSVHYFSPEQAKGQKATQASDLYSVGIILYEMLTGHVPFEGETAVSVAMMHLMKEPPAIEAEVPVSKAVSGIVRIALQKQPADRYQSAEAMIRDLRRGLRHPEGKFLKKEPGHSRPPFSGFRYLIAGITAVLLFGTVLVGYRLYATVFLMARVPDLTGLDRAGAERIAENAGFVPEWAYAYDETVTEGNVIAQTPNAGTAAKRGTAVVIRISQGSGRIVVPRLTGLAQAEAEQAALEEGLRIGEVRESISEVMKGLVIAQSPEAGAQAYRGDTVELTISVGRVIVPELVGLREEEAIGHIQQVGLSLGKIDYKPLNAQLSSLDGTVAEQSFPSFMEVEPGEIISLVVFRYPNFTHIEPVEISITVPENGCKVRVTLVDEDTERTMYSAELDEAGEKTIQVRLRSETAGLKKWRLYIDDNLKDERDITLL